MIVYKNNYEDEKLFSTGDSELDDILEEVYYSGVEDGYDYAQKEFAIIPSSQTMKKAAEAVRIPRGMGKKVARINLPPINKPKPSLEMKQLEKLGDKSKISAGVINPASVPINGKEFNNLPKRVRNSLETTNGGSRVINNAHNTSVLRKVFSE